ncbi:MAG: SUMF1/EgtB/PvdO family nonheme iron enzyme, partial [Clostridia bacterium]|nr:SUMF1/EgtB/PvdO family nonheme iron enzyme [Clostridia bacterium]
DVYVVSKETGIVYYLEGVKAGSKTYYTRTQDLIDIKERNEKEEEEPENVSAPVISSDGIITKTLASGEEESYLANIKVKGKNIKTIKYEIGIISSDIAKEYFKSNGASIASDRLKLKDKEHVTLYAENENGDYAVKYYYYGYPKIPTGFVASIYEGETTIEDGLVIYETDSLEGIDKETAMTTYNQYVWIPVDVTNFVRLNWSGFGGTLYPLNDNMQYVEPLTSTTTYVTNFSLYSEEVAQYNAMKASVLKNKGFFVGRYEAGYPQGKTVSNVLHDGTDKPVSKKGVEAWRNIDWDDVYEWTMLQGTAWVSKGAQYGVDTNPGASLVAKKTYENSSDVKSHLLYGIEWDAIMAFIAKKHPEIPGDTTRKYGNYSGTVQPTGFYGINNIYDLAGNLWEWTYETYYGRSSIYSYTGIGWRVLRGGGTSNSASTMGNAGSAGDRLAENLGNNSTMYGFRVALYLI